MLLNTIAVTGSTGMLGRHVTVALDMAGFQVIPLSRSRKTVGKGRSWDLTCWKTMEELDELFKGVDAIVHAGAAVPKMLCTTPEAGQFDANVRACMNIAEWARSRKIPIVYISSATVYADPNLVGIKEEASLGWSGLGGFYSMTKLISEDIFRREKMAGLQCAILRPSSIYGVGLFREKMVNSFITKAVAGETIELTEPVNDSVDLIHAADVANSIVRVLYTKSWETFNLAAGRLTSILELANACVIVAENGRVQVKASSNSRRVAETRFGLSCDRAKRLLDWRPHIGLTVGLTAMLNGVILCESERLEEFGKNYALCEE